MKIKTVDTHRCDNPKCNTYFEISDKKIRGGVLVLDQARLMTNNRDYHNANGRTYCPACTARILEIMGMV